MQYTVKIETSVSVDADTPQGAMAQAASWARESLENSNAYVKAYVDGKRHPRLVHSCPIEDVE